jgi:hypothetical protein
LKKEENTTISVVSGVGISSPVARQRVQEEVICNELVDFTFIRDGRLEKMCVRGGHHRGEISQPHGIGASVKEEVARNGSRGRSD